ncbi:MAG TPA: sigma-70 family RNA polymerase sigma factor [Candidatus Binatia bacterium]|nr:sigma-70 family RNA polymerase sigma factor [Candidatus Binatia bacterium]
MSTRDTFHSLSLTSLAQHCAEESDHFFHRRDHDPRYCFELFRRAIVEHNERAWTYLCDNYRPLVGGWVRRNRAFASSGEEIDYFVNGAFAKMWSAMSAEKFDSFSDLKSLLRYLQLCVSSVVTDHARNAEYHEMLEDLPPSVEEDEGKGVEDVALARTEREDFWQAISQRLNDDKERLVLHYSYIVGFKPGQIYDEKQDVFEDVHEIYRIKENVLARLRRDTGLQELLMPHA